MSFEIQELLDVIRVIALTNLSREAKLQKSLLEHKIDAACADYACIEMRDCDSTLGELIS